MTQPSFFDPEPETTQSRIAAKLVEVDAKLEANATRIRNGEAWLNKTGIKTHPLYERNRQVYRGLLEERERLQVEREDIENHWHVCTLILAPGIRYQPKGSPEFYDTIKVLYDGTPVAPDELSYEGFGEFLQSMKMVKQGMAAT